MPRPRPDVEYTKISVQVTRELHDRWLSAIGQKLKSSEQLRTLMEQFIQSEEARKKLKDQSTW
jgi:hypothetical protein